MEHNAAIIQKATDLVSQYEHFFAALKERATSFSGHATVSRSIEADFEALHVMLEERKNTLLGEVQNEMAVSGEKDLLELEDKKERTRSSLQKLQQLAVHGLLSEDNGCYRDLLVNLNETKQKLKETSDKLQLKYESCLRLLADKIATYGEVVSGRGNRGKDPVFHTKQSVDFARVFAALSQQFESCCQLKAVKQEKIETRLSSLSGWFDYSKGLEWRHKTCTTGSSSAVPDFVNIVRRMKDGFHGHVATTPESHEKWLVLRKPNNLYVAPRSEWLAHSSKAASGAVASTFSSVASSDMSSWLLRSPSSSVKNTEVSDHHNCSIPSHDSSLWLLPSERDKGLLEPLKQDYSEWLLIGRKGDEHQTSELAREDTVTSWLQQAYSWSDPSMDQWTVHKGGSALRSETSSLLMPPGGDSGGDILSDVFGSTHTLTSFGSSDFEVVDDTDL